MQLFSPRVEFNWFERRRHRLRTERYDLSAFSRYSESVISAASRFFYSALIIRVAAEIESSLFIRLLVVYFRSRYRPRRNRRTERPRCSELYGETSERHSVPELERKKRDRPALFERVSAESVSERVSAGNREAAEEDAWSNYPDKDRRHAKNTRRATRNPYPNPIINKSPRSAARGERALASAKDNKVASK